MPSLYGFRFTRAGVLYVAASLVIGLAAMNSQVNLLFLLFGLAMGALVVSGLISSANLRRLSVCRLSPEAAVATRRFVIRYELSNRRRYSRSLGLVISEVGSHPAGRVRIAAAVAAVGPGRTAVVEVPVVVPRRGRLVLERIEVSTRFPFGLFGKRAVADVAGQVVVYPLLGAVRGDPLRLRGLGEGQAERQGQRLGGTDEFYGLRDYRPGDSPRWIHWRRSARTGRLLIRQMLQYQPRQLILAVELAGARERELAGLVEQVISAAATLACDGLERGYRVGLICNSSPLVMLAPAGGRLHRPK
ncbi:MAG: DUF58 domain-containing protein, partial [Phycisphaerae bacterium]